VSLSWTTPTHHNGCAQEVGKISNDDPFRRAQSHGNVELPAAAEKCIREPRPQ
jgi:hypothetical protein